MRKFCLLTCLVLFLLPAACNSVPTGLTTGVAGSSARAIPAFLPDAVALEVGEVPEGDTSAARPMPGGPPPAAGGRPGDAGPVQRTLHAAGRIVHHLHRLADRSIHLVARIRHDLTDPNQTQVAGTLVHHGQTIAYKADFAAFDIDGDGTPDGSGSPTTEPVALRMWVDPGDGYVRFACALVTHRPSPQRVGQGQMYLKPGAAEPGAPGNLQVFVEWNRTDPAHAWTEAFLSGQLGPDVSVSSGHQRVDARSYEGGRRESTVRSATAFADNPFGLVSHQSAVHFVRGGRFALVSGLAVGGMHPFDFANMCVHLPRGMPADGGQCDAFDTQDMAYIALPAGGETDFPADFPETPTF
jgi:hypothetical protein